MSSRKKEFLKILSAYQGIIHKVNLIYFRSAANREDNFQEIIYQLWRSFPKLRDHGKIASWIYAIAINTSISKIRTDSRFVSKESITESEPTEPLPETIDFGYLLEAIQKLNETNKSIILLYLEEYSYDEIAEIIGLSRSHVGIRINRAKNQLKKLLAE